MAQTKTWEDAFLNTGPAGTRQCGIAVVHRLHREAFGGEVLPEHLTQLDIIVRQENAGHHRAPYTAVMSVMSHSLPQRAHRQTVIAQRLYIDLQEPDPGLRGPRLQ